MTMQLNEVPDTQSQPICIDWVNADSQPIEHLVWGRLYPKNVKLKSLDLSKDTISVGRWDSNDMILSLNEMHQTFLSRISKIHFKIIKDLSEDSNPVYIEDLSRNGTFVNGQLIGYEQKQILLNNDIISLTHPNFKAFVYKDLCPSDAHKLPVNISSMYHIGKSLGSGACGVVRLVYNRLTCEAYAMKHVQKNRLLNETIDGKHQLDPERVMNEVKILKNLNHPCVIKMHDIIDNPDSLFIVLELMNGGDLLSRILQSKYLSEKLSKLYFIQLCHAVKYLHNKNITHRDLKPDNVLLETKNEETLLKVSDFGLSKFVRDNSVLRTLCGTPLYVAPEILLTSGQGSYTKKVDIWSLGVVLFSMLSGSLPFSNAEQIKKGRFGFIANPWKKVSSVAKTLIMEMLTVDPKRRPSIDDLLQHTWLRDAEVIKKAERIMNLKISTIIIDGDEENVFQPPAAKRRRVERVK